MTKHICFFSISRLVYYISSCKDHHNNTGVNEKNVMFVFCKQSGHLLHVRVKQNIRFTPFSFFKAGKIVN